MVLLYINALFTFLLDHSQMKSDKKENMNLFPLISHFSYLLYNTYFNNKSVECKEIKSIR